MTLTRRSSSSSTRPENDFHTRSTSTSSSLILATTSSSRNLTSRLRQRQQSAARQKPIPASSSPSASTSATTSPAITSSSGSTPDPVDNTAKTPSPKIPTVSMFSSRKYTPLPTSASGSNGVGGTQSRKRSGGGMVAWKRYAILGTLVLVVLGLGYSQFGGEKAVVWDDENVYTPALDEANAEGFESPPFRPLGSEAGRPSSEHMSDEEEGLLHALPMGDGNPQNPSQDEANEDDEVDEDLVEAETKPVSNPHDPTSEEAQGADKADADFTEITDEEEGDKSGLPTSFEEDPNPASTTVCSTPYSADKPLVQYALTIDAGSTGSRIHVYKFHNCGPSPQLEYETFKMLNPGLSAFARDPTAAAASLDPLLEEAKRVVPEELRKCTPVEVKATAGLRLLGVQESVAILDEVRNRLETNWDFVVNGEKAVEIMDGKDEGVYAWITANYLLNKIGEGATSEDTLAVMDLGGASTQIVFEPTFPADSNQQLVEGEHKYQLSFGGKDFTLYQHSYLGYGLMRARRSVHNLIAFTWSFGRGDVEWEHLSESTEVPNPCLSKGTSRRVELDPPGKQPVNVTMHGANGGFEACNRVVELVMAKDAICEVKPCSFNGVYQPSLLDTFPRGQLLALSYFTDRIKPLLPASQGSSPITISDLTSLAKDVCAGPETWSTRFGNNPTAMAELEDRPEYCLDLTFMNALLGLGYELGPERELMVEKKLRGVELGWALGAGLALVEKAELKCTA